MSDQSWWGKAKRGVLSGHRVRERVRAAVGTEQLKALDASFHGMFDRIAEAMTEMCYEAGHEAAASGRDKWVGEQVAEARSRADQSAKEYRQKLSELDDDPRFRFAKEAMDRIGKIPADHLAKVDAVAVVAAAALGMTKYAAPGQAPDVAADDDGDDGGEEAERQRMAERAFPRQERP